MSQIVNPIWKRNMEEAVHEYRKSGTHISVTITFNAAAQWLVCYLDKYNVPYKVISLGAGAKKITTQTEICSKCRGTGKC